MLQTARLDVTSEYVDVATNLMLLYSFNRLDTPYLS